MSAFACSTTAQRPDSATTAERPLLAASAPCPCPCPLLVDVRTADEWAGGHAPCAHRLPVQDDASLVDQVVALAGGDLSTPIVTYCYSGGRAGRAEAVLEARGFTNVQNGGGYITPPGNDAVLDAMCAGCSAAAATVNHTLWNNVLSRFVSGPIAVDGIETMVVDYAAIRADDAEFRAYQAVLAGADVAGLPLPEVKALFINAYNCLAIGRIVDNVGAPIDGIRELGDVLTTVWKQPAGVVGGVTYSLDQIEHGPTGHFSPTDTVTIGYTPPPPPPPGVFGGLRPTFQDARIHASIVCASVSCPDISAVAFTAGTVESLLDTRAAAWVANTDKGFDVAANTASMIFSWYRDDFETFFPGGVVGFLRRFAALPPSGSAVAGAYIDGHAALDPVRLMMITYFEYDWNLNRPVPTQVMCDVPSISAAATAACPAHAPGMLVPAECTLGCAAVFVPLITRCGHAVASMPDDVAIALEGFFMICRGVQAGGPGGGH